MSRLLGTECLGHVRVYGSGADSMYVFSVHRLVTGAANIFSPSVAPRLGIPVDQEALSSVTRGLVGDTAFAVLPQISKEQTFALSFFFQLVSGIPSSSTTTRLGTDRL